MAAVRREVAPWTVVMQGSPLAYEDATLLDKLEYVVHAAPDSSALSRTLEQDGIAEKTTVSLLFQLYRLLSALPDSLICFAFSDKGRVDC